jgi:hypothetical protein
MFNNRKRTYSESENSEDSSLQSVKFQTNVKSIVLERECRAIYKPNKCVYDKSLVNTGSYWHQVLVSYS